MPLSIYFREAADLPDLELIALQSCKGSVLDIGAGAGSQALQLQEKGIEVKVLEISSKAAAVMKLRGVKSIIEKDIFEFEENNFDTLLLLMNGIGLTGNINRLKDFFQHAKKLLYPGGQLLFDSSGVAYLYDERSQKWKIITVKSCINMNTKNRKQIGLPGYTSIKRNFHKLQKKKEGKQKFYMKMNMISIWQNWL